ncbi:MAG: MaoC/PaaZ C-terminal domain-containing protein [Hyphomicrobiaceae bacterium]
MPFKAEDLLAYDIPEAVTELTPEACILYALGIGLGYDPMDERQLRFVFEEHVEGLAAFPTMACVLGYPGFWMREADTGVDWVKVLHGEQAIELHRALPTTGTVYAKTVVVGVDDKGPAKGAVIHSERVVRDRATDAPIATIRHTTFARGNGGSGSAGRTHPAISKLPERPSDQRLVLPTLPQQALIYRLAGDRNPLHADPETARKAGFARPILHGLSTYAVAGHAILAMAGGYRPDGLKNLRARFVSPVYPGESIQTEIWQDGARLNWRASVPGRDDITVAFGDAEVAA